jgi:ribose/xylose/arabinose/galactoside ABC-type transport system permease subunit
VETLKQDSFCNRYIRPVIRHKVFSLIIILLVLVAIFTVWSAIEGGRFFKASTLKNVLNSIVLTAFLTIGAGCLLISGALDLSQAAVGAFGGVILATAVTNWNLPWYIGILLCLVFCGILGAVNAIMVSRFRFPAFIATLAMTSMAKGLMYIFSAIGREGGVAANVSCNNIDALNYIGKGFIGPVPFGVIVMLIFFLFYGILMSRTKFGMKVVLMGGNPVAANLAGIKSKKITFILFINSAVLGGVAGVFSTARLSQGSLLALQTNQFTGLTAAILGGISFGGGSGGMGGAFIGLVILNSFQIGMQVVGVNPFWVNVFSGVILLIALATDFLAQKRAGNPKVHNKKEGVLCKKETRSSV